MSVLGMVARELIALWRYRLRRASVERVVTMMAPGGRVIDRDPDGAVIEVDLHDIGAGSGSDVGESADPPAA
ncbi:hypothetical protein [Amycolatopsis thailandensis]|uniref:hypothetical protein n=1 Tax=Amycolatopsis thailandensis TaxID=589330 RepID=UPI0011778625|nr:hypothetical protein [Amycolatopsis thailandensis]